MFSIRVGRARPFVGVRDYDDGAGRTIQAGITTYSGDDANQTYQTTYIEFGGRADHAYDLADKLQGKAVPQRFVEGSTESEQLYIGAPVDNIVVDAPVVEAAAA